MTAKPLSDTDLFAALVQVKQVLPMLGQALAEHISARAIEIERLERQLENQAALIHALRQPDEPADETAAVQCEHEWTDVARCLVCGMTYDMYEGEADADDIGPAPPYIAEPAAEAIARGLDAEIIRAAAKTDECRHRDWELLGMGTFWKCRACGSERPAVETTEGDYTEKGNE